VQNTIRVRQIVVDLGANSIVLFPNDDRPQHSDNEATIAGILDVGERGTMLGVELAGDYFEIAPSTAQDSGQVRSAPVQVRIGATETGQIERLEVPRHGNDYEISWPIGNQCWQRRDGHGRLVETCVTTIPRRPE
jgi:hypothetical protein